MIRLTPLHAKRALDALTALVVVSVAFALAGLTWRLAGHAGTGAVTVPSAARAASAPPDLSPALALAPFGRGAASEGAQPTGLALELKGVIAAVPAELSTAFIAVGGGAPTPFRVGDSAGGARIESILRDRVLLSNAGRSEYLAFPDPAQPDAAAGAAASPTPQAKAAPVAPPAPPAAGASALIARLGAAPAAGGYRIGENAPPGLQAGDVVQSVNGMSLGDPAAAQAAFASAAQGGSAQITVLRDGKPITLTVPTR